MTEMLQRVLVFLILLIVAACGKVTSPKDENDSYKTNLPPSIVNYKDYSLDRNLANRWNLVSIPIQAPMSTSDYLDASNNSHLIQSIWKWDSSKHNWQVFPTFGEFEELEMLYPDEGYWLRVRSAFDLTGNGPVANVYNFEEGWNLIGYSHSAQNISVENFFSEGDFWGTDHCEEENPVINAWTWENDSWKIYFPDPNGLSDFNDTYNTSFEAFTTLEPGIGLWVNSRRGSAPPTTSVCPEPDDPMDPKYPPIYVYYPDNTDSAQIVYATDYFGMPIYYLDLPFEDDFFDNGLPFPQNPYPLSRGGYWWQSSLYEIKGYNPERPNYGYTTGSISMHYPIYPIYPSLASLVDGKNYLPTVLAFTKLPAIPRFASLPEGFVFPDRISLPYSISTPFFPSIPSSPSVARTAGRANASLGLFEKLVQLVEE